MKRWAFTQFSNPWTVGGIGTLYRRFEVTVENYNIDLGSDIKGFSFTTDHGWRIAEQSTGGLIGRGDTEDRAIEDARRNVSATPDLGKQIEKIGDTNRFDVISTTAALAALDRP